MAHQTDNLPSCKAMIVNLLNTGKDHRMMGNDHVSASLDSLV